MNYIERKEGRKREGGVGERNWNGGWGEERGRKKWRIEWGGWREEKRIEDDKWISLREMGGREGRK